MVSGVFNNPKMNKTTITVGGKTYPLKFGYKTTKYLGELWQLNGVLDVYEHALQIYAFSNESINDLDVDKATKGELNEEVAEALGQNVLSFKNIEIIRDVLLAGIIIGNPKKKIDFDVDDFVDEMIEDFTGAISAFTEFIKKMPKSKSNESENEGKQKARQKARA